jgi:hypothetical protein
VTGLEPNAAHAVRALAAARTPGDGAAERAWLLMQQRIVDGPAPIDIGTATVATAGRARWIAIGVAIAAVVVAAAGLGSWRAGWLADGDGRPAAEASYSTTRLDDTRSETTVREAEPSALPNDTVPVEPAPAVEVEGTPAPVAVVKPETRSRPSKQPRRPAADPASPPSPAAKTTTLAAEMRLLAKANAAMQAGNPTGALAVLDEHARDFARGQLAPEREYKRAVALCELGRTDKARAIADAFVRAHPKSPLRAKAESVCRE